MAAVPHDRRGRRILLILGGAALLLLLVEALLWSTGSGAPPAAVAERAMPLAPAASPDLAASAARGGPASPPQPAPASAAEPEPPSELTTPAQPPDPPPPPLPPTTQLLAEEFYPGTTDWEEVPADDSRQATLRILPVRYNVVAPMPIAVLLEMVDSKGTRQPLHAPHVRMRAADDASRPWIDVPVKDDGSGADRQAGDLQYTATLRPDEGQRKALLGRVLVEGSVEIPGAGVRTIPAMLIYTMGPRARLTGRWTDQLRDGHLYLTAELEVEEAGLFTLMAQLFGPSLEPIAWVKQTEHLPAGRGSITLQVWGKAIHDSGIDGPYRVRQVLLSRDYESSSDYDPGVTIEEAHRTNAYHAKDFSAADYTPPPRELEEEITADSPSQVGKPPPLRDRILVR